MMGLTLLNLDTNSIKAQAAEVYSLTDPGLVASLVGLPTYSGKAVTRTTAIRCTTLLAGIKMLAGDTAKLPLITYERTIVAGRQRTNKALDNPLYPILKDCPNAWMTSYQMRFKLIWDLFLSGNFYVQKIVNGLGEIVSLVPLTPWFITPRWDKTLKDARGNIVPRLFFDYDDGCGSKVSYLSTDLWWCSLMNIYGVEGQAIIALAKEALSVLMASDELAGRFFHNGMMSSGFITTDPAAQITPAEAQKLTDDVNKFFSGVRNAGKSPLIPYGAKYEKMQFTAAESQLIESRKWNSEEVIRVLGGQALLEKLGYGKSSTYAATAANLEDYFNTSLLPIVVNIEQTITRDLIDPEDRATVYVKHNPDILLRGSHKERAETNKILVESGQRNPNELRENDDLDPVDGWDLYFFPANSGVFNPETGETYLPAQKVDAPGNPQPQDTEKTAAPAKTQLAKIADSLAERVLRKEAKAQKVDAKYVAEVCACPLEKAEAYCKDRESGKIPAEQARVSLVALVTGENHE